MRIVIEVTLDEAQVAGKIEELTAQLRGDVIGSLQQFESSERRVSKGHLDFEVSAEAVE